MRWPFSFAAVVLLLSFSFSVARGQDAPDTNAAEPGTAAETKPAAKPPSDVKGSVLLSGLDNPRAIAIQPGTGALFISESGAGQIVRFDPSGSEKTAVPVVAGSPLDTTGQPPLRNIGPLGLAFIGRDVLVVGEGGQKVGSDTLRFYAVPAAGETIKYENTSAIAGPIAPGDDSQTGEGNFNALVIPTGTAAFVTSSGDEAKGWILRCQLNAGKPVELKPLINTKSLVGVDAPMAITLERGGNLVVANAGKFAGAKDSVLSFFNPATGKLLMKRDTGLYDIMGLAYSPKASNGPESGYLYAVDLAWTKAGEGGLYRLDATTLSDGSEGVKAVKIAALDKPTALAIAGDGTVYVTVMGTFREGDRAKPGQVIKFSGL